jgi:hypothetical protein
MTATALNILDNDPDGFFLMVEGGRIDDACHSNDLTRTIPEVNEFADAVQAAIDWAAGRNDTLIIVAADHETGGLTVTANNGAGALPGVTWDGTGHTATNVPVYAWGVNADLIDGVMDNTNMVDVVKADQPIQLVQPAYDAAHVLTSPTLEVTVYDPDAPLDVTFYGRQNPSFTIVVLPDSQKYLLNGAYPQIFTSQTQWIVDNAVSENIVFVTHEGDIVDTWNSTTEWGNANESIGLLDGVVPYGLAVGNHDKYENPADPMYSTISTYFNQTFPYTRYQNEPWYGGHYPAAPDPNGNSNSYQVFSAGGDDYIVLHLEDYPTYEAVAWADGVLKANAGRRAIITTHGYMDTSGNYTGKWGSTQYIRDLVVGNNNVYFVLCGHFTGEYTKITTVNGRLVHEMMADYQGRANGGDGWLRILRFEPDEDKVYVKTYSTWHDAYEADSGSQFTLDFPMSGYAFSVIGTNNGVASGANTSLTWPGRKMETQYQWYVTMTDTTAATTTGPVWSFTTGSPKAGNPSPVDGAADVDTNADLGWSAGVDAVSHDVYFGTDASNLPLVSAQQSGATYDPGLLQMDTTYYWAIDEHNSVGGVTYGDVWSFTTAPPAPLTFQQGVNGYAGMADTMICYSSPNKNYADSAVNYESGYQYQYNSDTSSGSPAGPAHVLLRFDNIIGSGAGQIPAGSTILSATLRLRTLDDSNGGKLHRILQSWSAATITWANSFGGNGIQADGSEAAVTEDAGVTSTSGAGDTDLNVTATVQGYVDGTITNNGWAILPNGSNGWHIAAAEHPTVDYRPELIVSFTQPQNQPAGNPNPADGAAQVAVDADISWTAGAGAVSHDVYFGTAQPPAFVHNQTGTTYDPGLLLPNTTYYWQIDERDALGGVVTGAVRSFTTAAAPTQASNPNPGDGTTEVSKDAVLSWTPGSDTTSHNVYFGTDLDPRVNTPVNQTDAVFDPPGLLAQQTTYYWAIDEVGPGGTTGGQIWTFTTIANQAPTANAGIDQTVSNADGTGSETVTLNGSGSDTDGTIVSYEWKEDENVIGSAATITSDLALGAHTITLTVTDNGGATGSDEVTVTVNANQAPTANAGTDQTVTDNDYNGSESVTLSGSGADPDGTITAYEWKEGTTPLGTGPNISVDLAVGEHTITLMVTDNGGATGSDNVIVTVEEGPAAINDTANSDIIVSGTITSGSYASTANSDNAYEAIREIRQGNASTGKSLLEHKWTINVTGGSDVSFHVEAYRTANSEGDNFVFAYSTDNVTYTNLLTVTKTADDNTVQSAALPSSLSGTVYVRVQDTDRTKGRTSLDTIYIDQMFIRSQGFGPDTSPPSPNPMTWAVAPYAASSTSVSMTATTASDVSGVEYYFTCTAGGGNDSGWQNSPTYEDTGLTPETSYTYTVKARDKSANQNETAVSTAESATTQPGGAAEVYVNDIAMGSGISGKNYYAQATVWIRNNSGANVAAATVYGNWSGAVTGSANGITGTDGKVTLRSPNARNGGTFTFTVTNVVISGYTYNPGLNLETSDSITNP